MDRRVGTILRDARKRRNVDLSEVEAATRIRARYLRAIESEEWDVLPGGVYTRGFIRTYASFLGLDGERLANDYRSEVEGAGREHGPIPASMPTQASPRRAVPPSGWAAVAAVILVAVLAIVLLPGGGSGGGGTAHQSSSGTRGEPTAAKKKPGRGVLMRLTASAEIWVCVLDAKGKHLVDGQILEAGAEEGPFRSGSFTVSFGNGGLSMTIDGKQADIPATPSPIGYSIDPSGKLTELDEAERPTCA